MSMYCFPNLETKEMTLQPAQRINQFLMSWFIDRMKERIEEHAPKVCTLDFSRCSTASDEIGMNIIATILHEMEERNGKLRVCGLDESLLNAFMASEISKKVEVFEEK